MNVMQLAIEPAFAERVVFEAVRAEGPLTREYQREFAQCFADHDGDARERAFADLHDRWFDRLGFRGVILAILEDYPLVRRHASRVVVADARARGRQSVELLGKPGRYAVIMTVTGSLLVDRRAFDYWARHELQHVEDILDPAFAFDATIAPESGGGPQLNLMRERYALLWAISIDARLSTRPTAPPHIKDRRRDELRRAFAASGEAALDAAFEQLWTACTTERPGHRQLIEWARTGVPGLHVARNGASNAVAMTPGAACPLCKFPTHDWAPPDAVTTSLTTAVQSDFPDWTPSDGICGRCAEIYRPRAKASPARAGRPGSLASDISSYELKCA